MAKPYYTSADLVEAVKRKASVPISQNTFSEDDILKFANEEMFLAQVPSILEFHEEYLVYEQNVPLRPNISRYPIPPRAIGMKCRDVFYRDEQGNLIEMAKINPDDKSFFGGINSNGPTPYHYYVQNNSIVVSPGIGEGPRGSLQFSYFLRPNSLVLNDRAAISTSFSKNITLLNNLVAGDKVTIDGTDYVAGTDFAIGINEQATAQNLATLLANTMIYTASTNSNVVTFGYMNRNTSVISSNVINMTVQSTLTINFVNVPANITNGSLVDILQMEGGHSTLGMDVRLGNNASGLTTITFNEADISADFVVGDYVCSQYECIVPQVPSDLHNLLAERTCARILESIGDLESLKMVNLKIQEQEARQSNIIDNRVEGSPQKVFNRRGLLRSGRSTRIRGF